MMIWRDISKTETNLFKGIAILMIVIHNFLHRFPTPKENEMVFFPERIFDLLSIITTEPQGIIRALFSFFGHFGVQIFIFLSAYGLTKKYHNNDNNIIYFSFIKERLLKIYPMFLLALLSYLIYMSIYTVFYEGLSLLPWLQSIAKSFIFKVTLLFNLYPGQGYSLVGPWWFMSFIFQFYLVFPFMLSLYKKYGTKFLVLISCFAITLSFLTNGTFGNVSIFFTVLGHVPVLCLGMYFAKEQEVKIPNIALFALLLIYFVGNVNEQLFFVSHFCMALILIYLFTTIVKKLKVNSHLYKLFMFFGTISMPLFLVNGFLRAPLEGIAHKLDNELITLVLCVVCVSIASLYAICLQKMDTKLHALINKLIGPKNSS